MPVGMARSRNLHSFRERESDFGRIQIEVIKSLVLQDSANTLPSRVEQENSSRVSIYIFPLSTGLCLL